MGSRSKEEMQALMNDQDRVRNVSVIAHVDHGKTTLTDSLLAKAGLIKQGQDTRKDEQERGITIKSTAVSLVYDLTPPDTEVDLSRQLLVNLIDSPGHVDFSSEVTAALRVSDGALVVVDSVSGVCVQTETVLRQALSERIRPVLVINKMDRCILEKQLDPEELYQNLSRIIDSVNSIIQIYSEEDGPLGDIRLDPGKGNVAFAAGLQGWGFTVPQMAEVYSSKFKSDPEKMKTRLWGNHFFDSEKKKWQNKKDGESASRGFCKFVLEPIYKILQCCQQDKQDEALAMASKLGVVVPQTEVAEGGSKRDLIRSIMSRWLPAADAMLEVMDRHLPSPKVAQAYRTQQLYEGPLDDEVAVGMRMCDPTAPLMMYVTKMVPSHERGRFLAFGRVFSGTLSAGQKVYILGPNYTPGTKDKTEKQVTNVPRVLTLIVGATTIAYSVPAGSVCAVAGIDKYLLKTGTLTTYPEAHNLKVLKFSVSPVVQVAVDVQKPQDLPKLVEGLRRLAKSDPMVQVTIEQGQNIVAGAGELHLEICLKDLEEVHANVPIKKSQPVVSYKETVSALSDKVCLAKSTNKHNRIYMTAQPLEEAVVEDIEKGIIFPSQDPKERARYLVDTYGWDVNEARKIWSFGPAGSGPNILVDCTKGIQNLTDAKDMITAGFQWATQEGILCEEGLRGVRYNLMDALIHTDPACRKGGQVIPTTRRAIIAATLTAKPRLQEPVFLVQIQVPETCLGSVYGVLHKRRGVVIEETQPANTPLFDIKAHLPVGESFGFSEELRANTSGQAFPQCVFDHWQELPGDPQEAGSLAASTMAGVRERKNMAPHVPPLENFLDKL